MPFDSNGTYNRVRFWVNDAAASVKIRADYHDAHDSDMAAGLSTCITKDGRTQPSANLPMNGKKIVNHGDTLASDPPSTVATKSYVDNFKAFATGLSITGANYPNGMIHFAATTGITGLSWVNADMSWVGKVADAGKWPQRLAVTNDAQGAGTELVAIDKAGRVNLFTGQITNNLSYDTAALPAATWRTNKLGTGSALQFVNGTLTLLSNDTPTLQDNQTTTLQTFYTLGQTTMTHNASNGSCVWQMQKRDPTAAGPGGTGPFTNSIRGMVGSELRWNMELGNAVAETGTAYVGSNFVLTAYNNAGTGGKTMMQIDRSTNKVTFYGDVYSSTTSFVSSTTTAILASGAVNGAVYLRPNGPDSATEQVYVDSTGDFHISGGHMKVDANTTKGSYLGMGQQGRNGTGGAYTGYWHNWVYSAGNTYVLVDNSNKGYIQIVCDYRTKKNTAPLPSMWDKVKALKPISYQYKEQPGERSIPEIEAMEGGVDRERWGFVAHELQEALTPSAASFSKDVKDALQSPNMLVVVAALTKALQEAMQRIEALEAR